MLVWSNKKGRAALPTSKEWSEKSLQTKDLETAELVISG